MEPEIIIIESPKTQQGIIENTLKRWEILFDQKIDDRECSHVEECILCKFYIRNKIIDGIVRSFCDGCPAYNILCRNGNYNLYGQECIKFTIYKNPWVPSQFKFLKPLFMAIIKRLYSGVPKDYIKLLSWHMDKILTQKLHWYKKMDVN